MAPGHSSPWGQAGWGEVVGFGVGWSCSRLHEPGPCPAWTLPQPLSYLGGCHSHGLGTCPWGHGHGAVCSSDPYTPPHVAYGARGQHNKYVTSMRLGT